jgi:R3H domain/G-patch domain
MEDEPAREVNTHSEPEQAQKTIDKPTTSVQEDATEEPSPEIQPFRERAVSTSSESSSEEIVFLGRQKGASARPAPPPVQPTTREVKKSLSPPPPNLAATSNSAPIVPQITSQLKIDSQPFKRGQGRKSKWELDEEEAIMQDYIDNLAMDDDEEDEAESGESLLHKNEHYRFFDGAREENVKVQTVGIRRSELDQAIDWSSVDLQDFDGLNTTDEEIMEVTQVLRKRQRPNGLQYLVSGVGMQTSDAKWILHERLTSSTAQEEIRVFEEIRQMERTANRDNMEESSTDGEEGEGLDDKVDSEDENARLTARMTDEQIARALAKQEELGMNADEVLLFDGQVDDQDGNDDGFSRGYDFVSFSMSKHTSNRTRSKKNNRAADGIPSATAFADALDEDPYGGFDIMDFDRPSLRPKPKGRKSDFVYDPDLIDEELAEALRSTWHKDREKKAARKQEKAEARANSMLDSTSGSDPDAIRGAIRAFLVRENDTLSLPVMPAHTRASVHRLAKALHLNSRSEGKGDNRHPILTKTSRTAYYSLDTIWEIDALMNQRRFFPRSTTSYKRPKDPRIGASGSHMRRGGGGNYSGATYMDGEVVGASAPEIGSDNKGRAMLEKMGWSSGMGIGADGNKGPTDVIKHVVKNTKAGLG